MKAPEFGRVYQAYQTCLGYLDNLEKLVMLQVPLARVDLVRHHFSSARTRIKTRLRYNHRCIAKTPLKELRKVDTFDTLLVNKRRIDEALAALRARRGDDYHDVVSMTCAGAMLLKLASIIASRNPDVHHQHLVDTISQFVATAGGLSCKLLPDTSISDLIQDAEMILSLGDLNK